MMRVIVFLMVAFSFGVVCCGAESIEAFTRPSDDVTLSFVRPGLIAKMLVKEGDQVRQGQLLVAQDDLAEMASLEQLKAKADDTVQIDASKADLDQKRVDFEKLEKLGSTGAAGVYEREHARLDVVIGEMRLKLYEFERMQDGRKYEEAKLQLDRMLIFSPVAGVVEQSFIKQGESVNALDKVIRVVKIDPLWIDIPAPLTQVRSLGIVRGGEAQIEFPAAAGQTAAPRATGKVIHVGAVADPASGTLTVRVEVPNSALRQAGERVKVVSFLPPPVVVIPDVPTEPASRPADETPPATQPATQPAMDLLMPSLQPVISGTGGMAPPADELNVTTTNTPTTDDASGVK